MPLTTYKESEKSLLSRTSYSLLPYPDATFDLTDMHNGIYLDNMVCHNSCQCLFSQIYYIFKVQTITSDDYTNSKEAKKKKR